METLNRKKIILTGGGTGGSASPLLAVADLVRRQTVRKGLGQVDDSWQGYDFVWVGTKKGPENEMVKKAGIRFVSISSGKLRRYWSWENFIDPFKILAGFFQAIFVLIKEKPDLVMSAGGFVSVSVVWAAWFLRRKILIHQQDVRSGLANKLMAPFADIITVCFEKSLIDYGSKAVWVGNPVRLQIVDDRRETRDDRQQTIGEMRKQPMVLIVGGSTGAGKINLLTQASVSEITSFAHIVHITGKGKDLGIKYPGYEAYEFVDIGKMSELLKKALIVVSRSGLNLLTELAFLKKPAIIIPISDSHQEENAEVFKKAQAAIVLNEKELDASQFAKEIRNLVLDKDLQSKLSGNIGKVIKRGANEAIAKIISKVIR